MISQLRNSKLLNLDAVYTLGPIANTLKFKFASSTNRVLTFTLSLPKTMVDHAVLGSAFAIAGILLNVSTTMAVMTNFPSSDFYDEWWKRIGFCVNFNENRHYDTEVACAFVLCTSSVVSFAIYRTMRESLNNFVQDRLTGGIFGNMAHGLGHIFVYCLKGPPPAVKVTWAVDGLAYCIVLVVFFAGSFRATVPWLQYQQAFAIAIVVIATQIALDVPQELAFTYSQSAIILASSIGMLFIPQNRKGIDYSIASASLLPLFIFFSLESTTCKRGLAAYGGHFLYDLYLSLLPFITIYLTEKNPPPSTTKKGL